MNATPLLKYPGGKRKKAAAIAASFDDKTPFCDLFVGSGAVSLAARARNPERWHVGGEASSFTHAWWEGWLMGKDPCRPPTLERDDAVYYALRERFNEGAALTLGELYYLNKVGFNGLVRFNGMGGYNVSVGKAASPTIPAPDLEQVRAHKSLGAALLLANTWEGALRNAGPTASIYADAPFLGGFAAYTAQGWSAMDLDALCAAMARRDNPALLSEHTGGEAQVIIERHGGDLVHTWPRSGSISAKADERQPVSEGIWAFNGATWRGA